MSKTEREIETGYGSVESASIDAAEKMEEEMKAQFKTQKKTDKERHKKKKEMQARKEIEKS